MSITKELKVSNVVLVASGFDPSVLGTHWLVEKGICTSEDLLPNATVTPDFAHLATKNFQLVVLKEQLQFYPNSREPERIKDNMERVLPLILSKMQPVLFNAMGCNFDWHLNPETLKLEQFTREIFPNTQTKLFHAFEQEDSRFGSYMSRNYLNCRLKLTIRPVNVTVVNEGNSETSETVQFSFNFHKDLSSVTDKLADVLAELKNFQKYQQESERTVNLI